MTTTLLKSTAYKVSSETPDTILTVIPLKRENKKTLLLQIIIQIIIISK